LLSQMAQDMKAILQKSYYAQKLLDADIDKRTEIRLLMEKITPTLSDMPRGGSDDDKMCTALIRLEALDSKIENDVHNLTDLLVRNRILIDSLDDYELRMILSLRYVNFIRWDRIARIVHSSRTRLVMKHDSALEILSKSVQNGT